MGTILSLIYIVWAFYAGFRFVSGRSWWLEQRAPINMICKCLLSLVIGYFIGAFYFIYLIWVLIRIIIRM